MGDEHTIIILFEETTRRSEVRKKHLQKIKHLWNKQRTNIDWEEGYEITGKNFLFEM